MTDSRIELYRLKWFLGQCLALLALWTVSALDLARGPVWAAVLAVTVAVTLFPGLPARLGVPFRRVAAPLLVLVFVGDLVLAVRVFIRPRVRLLLLLLALPAASHRTNGQDLQLVLLAMFLSVVSGVFTLSMLFAVQAFLFAFFAIGLLFLVNLFDADEVQKDRPGEWESFSWKEFFGWIRRSFDLRMARSLAFLLVLLLGTTGLLFVSIPRVYLDQAIPFLRLPQEGLTGFNDTVRFGDVTAIQEDDGIAMRIDVPGRDEIPPEPYWRMLVLDRYDDGLFQTSLFGGPNAGASASKVHSLEPFPPRWFDGEGLAAGDWTFYLEGGVSRYLPLLGPFGRIRFQGNQPLQANPQALVFRIPEATSSVFSYQVEDFLVGPSVPGSSRDQPLLEPDSPVPENRENLYPFTTLRVPVSESERSYLDSLLETILGDTGPSPLEKAERIGAYLSAEHRYTLSPGGFGEGDPVVQWLREGRAGHCELFAGAFTLLARSAGIPTRMVVGFSGGSWNSYEDYFVVRNRNAHAWCEVFDGSDWVRFDPTPGSGGSDGGSSAGNGAVGFSEETDFQAWVDSLRVMWYRRVINFDDSSQQEMVEGLSDAVRRGAEDLRDGAVAFARGIGESARRFWNRLVDSGIAWPAVVTIAVLGAAVVWLLRRFPGLLAFGGGSGATHPLRRRAGRELRRLENKGERIDPALKRELEEDLLAIRFGRRPSPPVARKAFARSRRERRRASRWPTGSR